MKELRESIFRTLPLGLIPMGYDPKLKGQAFNKKMSWGRWIFHVGFASINGPLKLVVNVAIRVDAVNNLVFGTDPLLSKAEARDTATVGAELGNLIGKGPLMWTVSDPGEVPSLVASMLEAYEKIGLPYLSRYSDLEEMLRGLRGNGQEAFLLDSSLAYRCMKAVALAKVLEKENEIDTLIGECSMALDLKEDKFELNQFKGFLSRGGFVPCPGQDLA